MPLRRLSVAGDVGPDTTIVIDHHSRLEDLPELIRVDEYAQWAGISRWLTYELIRRVELPVVRLGRLVRIRREGLSR